MFSDTGNLSLLLSGSFILVSLCGIFVIYSIIKHKTIESENIDKIIELGKWFVVSVAITLSASIINDGFREREQDIKEMEVFDRYVSIILEADSIEKRKLLCEYFASVSPQGDIKKAWIDYEKIVDKHIAEIREDEKKIIAIANKTEKGTASASEVAEKARLTEKVSALSQSLLSNQSNIKPRVYFHIRNESQRIKAKQLASKVESLANVIVPGVQRLDIGPSTTELRFFKKTEEQEAKLIAEALSSLDLQVEIKYVPGFESSNNIRPRHYELWISSDGL